MTKRTVILALIVSFLVCNASQAAIVYTPNGQVARPEQSWINRSNLPYGAGWSFTAKRENCQWGGKREDASCVLPSEPATLYLQRTSGGDPVYPEDRRFALYHETYHSMSMRANEAPWMLTTRTEWLRINMPSVSVDQWWDQMQTNNILVNVTMPEEIAADSFAYCAITPSRYWGAKSHPPISSYGWAPTRARTLSTCNLFKESLR